jgi:hypothetical protein
MLHFWTWQADHQDGQIRLTPDPQTGGHNIGPTELVASIFNVPVASVRCTRPGP